MGNARARVAVFLSGSGSNLQALIDATYAGTLHAEIALVISNKPDAYGLTRAKDAGINTICFQEKSFASKQAAASYLATALGNHGIDYIALAGYLRLLPESVVKQYKGKIVNIHPGPLPKYGGAGMYGHHVHEAVLAAHEKESAASVHLVDEIYDHGRVLDAIPVPVMADDTPDTLAARVLEQEHILYPRVLQALIEGQYGT